MSIKYTWTKEENEFLIKNYSTMTLKELSNCLNRRDSTISKHARDVLGLGHKKLPGLVTDIEKDYPDLWAELLRLDKYSPVSFKPKYTVQQLDEKFEREEQKNVNEVV